MLFICYPKCSTCIKAKNYLLDNNIKFIERHIKESNPTYDELSLWINTYSLDINKLFNTSGLLYKEMNLKDKLKDLNNDDKIKLLSSNGMLVKRPILVDKDFIIFGFKEDKYKEKLNIK